MTKRQLLLMLSACGFLTPSAYSYQADLDIYENLSQYRNETAREDRPCILLGEAELTQALFLNVGLNDCLIPSKSESEYSRVLDVLAVHNVKGTRPISPIPSYRQILSFAEPFVSKNRILTLLATPDTLYLANDLSAYIEGNSDVKVQIVVTTFVYDLAKTIKQIKGDVALLLHDPEIYRNHNQVKSFIRYMLRRQTPVIGVSPYFKELGGLIEFSKPEQYQFTEVLGIEPKTKSFQIEYWPVATSTFSIEKLLSEENIEDESYPLNP